MVVTEKQLRAITNLQNNPDFEIFKDFLATWMLDEIKQMTYSEQPVLSQGRNQVLRELSRTIEDARESSAKLIAAKAVGNNRGNAF